ncbi:MAG: tRNA pseudouridine(38-40) synthase TruA [Candidatus Omnitrophota bacterium]
MRSRNVPIVQHNAGQSGSRCPGSMSGPSGRNIRLKIEYDGTNYCGWQRQKSPQSTVHSQQKKAIQEVIEETLHQILREKIRLIVSGRTDAGVHAKAQTANFFCKSAININKLHQSINALLPEDIAVNKIEEVPLDFHSRFCAKSKVYRYTILNSCFRSALLRDYVYFTRYPLDIKLMRGETKCLLGRHDFKAFCASASGAKTTIRKIKKISINRNFYTLSAKRYPLIIVDIEADGFLYNMVRNIVGTLIEIGRGRFSKGSLKKILRSKNRKIAGPTAPAKGLCLLEVKY